MSRAHCPSNVEMEWDECPEGHEPTNVLLDSCDKNVPVPNYWAADNYTTDQSFAMDYGCPILMRKFQIKNSMGNSSDRFSFTAWCTLWPPQQATSLQGDK